MAARAPEKKGSKGAARDRPLLIEIGTEELPPKALQRLSAAFGERLNHYLIAAHLMDEGTDTRLFATPRRLAVLFADVRLRQRDQTLRRYGPFVHAAFDADGKPTAAALGFARSCGIDVDGLDREETDKGPRLVYVQKVRGQPAGRVIPPLLEKAVGELPVPRRMRWGGLGAEFVRPVHWLVALHDDRPIRMDLLSVRAGNTTRGHRFHHPLPLAIRSTKRYADLLEQKGHVMPVFAERRARIEKEITRLAAKAGGRIPGDDELLDEVTGLVEWPCGILGEFDKRFLDVPREVLITTMRNHQKYFPVVNRNGRLLPYFVAISNIRSRKPAVVQAGYERVLRARFADARFFWETDRKIRLEDRVPALKDVIFHVRLGTLYDKTRRVQQLAARVAEALGSPRQPAQRATLLAKADLVTAMVGEFPTLQGVMGRYYAQHDGEPPEVAEALAEQYLPRFAGDELPATATGQALAIADRLDTLTGIFGVGELPTGDKDPFGLRRAALGVLRIMIERDLDLDLAALLDEAARLYGATLDPDRTAVDVFGFMMERLRAYYSDAGISPDVFEAVLSCRPVRPKDFDLRVRAVEVFRRMPEAESLTAANKRIANILRQAGANGYGSLSSDLLQELPERELAMAMMGLAGRLAPLIEKRDYETYLVRLAGIRGAVDAFFDKVMVMVDDERLRANRLALLAQTRALFLRIADLSCLQG